MHNEIMSWLGTGTHYAVLSQLIVLRETLILSLKRLNLYIITPFFGSQKNFWNCIANYVMGQVNMILHEDDFKLSWSHHFESFTVATTTWLTFIQYLCHKWPRIYSTCKHFSSFPRSWLITGFLTRLTRRVSLVEQELPTLPGHPSSPPVFSRVRVTRSLVLYVCFVDRCFFFWPLCCLFFFDIQILITPLVSSNTS